MNLPDGARGSERLNVTPPNNNHKIEKLNYGPAHATRVLIEISF